MTLLLAACGAGTDSSNAASTSSQAGTAGLQAVIVGSELLVGDRTKTPRLMTRLCRLQTDPWVFLIDSKGLIRTRFEGVADVDELRAGIDQLLAAP